MIPAPAIALLLVAQGPHRPPRADSAAVRARRTLEAAEHALEHDSLPRLSARWRAAPPADRAARLGLAEIARLTYRLAEADSIARSIIREGIEDNIAVEARAMQGRIAIDSANRPLADSLLTLAARDAERLGDSASAADLLALLARVRVRTAGSDAASLLLARARRWLPAGDAYVGARLECVTAIVLSQRAGSGALAHAARGVTLARQAGSLRAEGVCRESAAREWLRLGETDSAIAAFREAAEAQTRGHDQAGAAGTLSYLGEVLRLRGELGEARRALEASYIDAAQSAGKTTQAWATLLLGQISAAVLDVEDASVRFRQAALLMHTEGDRWGEARVYDAEAALAIRAGDPGRAREALDRAEAVMGSVSNPGWETLRTARELDLARLSGDRAGARAEFERLRRLRTPGGAGWEGIDLDFLEGSLELEEGNYRAAARAFARVHAPASLPPLHAAVLTRRAEVAARLGDLGTAELLLDSASTFLDRWRASLNDRELRRAALAIPVDLVDPDLGTAGVIAALAQGGRAPAGFRLAESVRARELLDRVIGHAALADSLPARAHAMRGSHALEEIQRALRPDEALLDFVAGRRGEPTTLFAVTARDIRHWVLPPADSLAPLLHRLQSLLQAGDATGGLSRRVGTMLLGAVLPTFPAGITRLIVVPDGPLHDAPFETLRPNDDRALIERYEIAIVPSASLLVELRRRQGTSTDQVVAFGDPLRAGPLLELPALPGAAREARAVAAGLTHSRTLLGAAATSTAFRQAAAERLAVLHLAVHARVDSWGASHTGIVLAPGPSDDGVVRLPELESMHIGADLVVLSGCRTTGGQLVAGEGIVGLTSAMLGAGARAVVATAWPVTDEGAERMVRAFYEELRRGRSSGEALRAAKLEIRRQDGTSEWAAWQLVGDPALRVRLTPRLHWPYWVAGVAMLLIIYRVGGVGRARIR